MSDDNCAPFVAIGMSEKEKKKVAAAIYGIPVERIGGGWPVDRSGGENALMRCTHLLMALYRHIEDGADMVAIVRADIEAAKAKLQAKVASLSDADKAKIDAFNTIIADGDFGCKTDSVRKLGVFLMGIDPSVYDAYTELRRSENSPKDAE